jgi:putative ABC transport system permease protein
MNLSVTFKLSIQSLITNKLTSCLAMLGMIFGVGSVITVFSLGESLRSYVISRFTSLTGVNTSFVGPAIRRVNGVRKGTYQNFTIDDGKAIVNEINGIKMASPIVRTYAQLRVQSRNEYGSIYGVAATYFEIVGQKLKSGRSFTAHEVESGAKVAIIGNELSRKLFPFTNPLGEKIGINGIEFEVIGALEPVQLMKTDLQGELVLAPYTVVMKRLTGEKRLSALQLAFEDTVSREDTEKSIASLLRHRHHLPVGKEDDFIFRNIENELREFTKITRVVTAGLGAIAAISLLVGGIGIMNIMLISVTERTREIGIRKAIGARDRDIKRQFLLEALTMSLIGGLSGTAIALGFLFLIGYMLAIEISGFGTSIILALSFSSGVGLFFGWWPASRASGLDPITCLRYE